MQHTNQTPCLFRRCDIIVFGSVLLLAAIFFLTASGAFSHLSSAGQEKYITVQTAEDTTVYPCEEKTIHIVSNDISLSILIDKDGAVVRASDCPDQICVHSGKITKIGARIVCVPAQCVITVTASPAAEKNDSSETKKGGEEVDAVVG